MGAWPLKDSGANRQIGETQRAILARAAAAASGQVIIGPDQNADWCAVKRLVQRGLMSRHVFGSGKFGTLSVYQITARGRAKLKEGS